MGSRAGAFHPFTPSSPPPQLRGRQCRVVLWSLPGLLVLAREHKRLAWVLHVLPLARPQGAPSPRGAVGPPTQPSSLIQAPTSPTRLWGLELGEAVPGSGAGCACHQLTADGSYSSEMALQTAAINTSIVNVTGCAFFTL